MMRGAARRRLPVGEGKLRAREHSRAALTRRLLVVAALTMVAAAAGSGRSETALGFAESSGSSDSASAPVSATAIAAGLGQSCALTRTGGAKCWGSNGHDELGDGRMRDSVTPVDVSGLSSGVTAIAAGLDHTCALRSTGGVKCWGYNRFGELGDGTTSHRWTPVDVSGLSSGVKAIAAGGFHTCALTTAGGVKCWGGAAGNRLTPVDVPGLSGGVTAIAAGSGQHGCALPRTGGVKCWGSNDHGQLGDGTTSSRSTAVDVVGLSGGVTAVAVGAGDSCALTGTGGVKCWGLNDSGQLGDGTTSNHSTPVDVSGLTRGVTAIAAGSFHSCVLTTTKGVKCWGLNGSGQLGDRTTVNRPTPVGVTGFAAAKATLAIVSRSVTVTPARIAAVKLRCGSQARCQGGLTLTASGNGQLVGSRSFAIAPGRTARVEVKLTARGFKLLVRVKRLLTRVRLGYKQPAGGTATATRTITLTLAK